MKREEKIKIVAKSLNKRTFGLSLQKEENLWLATVIVDDLEAGAKKRREAKKAEKAVRIRKLLTVWRKKSERMLSRMLPRARIANKFVSCQL